MVEASAFVSGARFQKRGDPFKYTSIEPSAFWFDKSLIET